MVLGELMLRRVLGSRILEFTHVGGLVPSLASGPNQVFHLGNLRPMAYDELTHGAATSI